MPLMYGSKHIATHLVLVLVLFFFFFFLGATVFKSLRLRVSHRIGMKFGRIILQVKTGRLTMSDFRFGVTLSRWSLSSFHAEICCRLVSGEYTRSVCPAPSAAYAAA